eukprot:CAMPEP_0117650772 /NCGR_PEP_ID=MMETSP0804-20121206/1718_1 /TAXON_ID=1074897 /ORGANISM="Tetraselmis astigmatica, Strain CCMP880" /LENGTH=346 /DNA_ID=CAMNT_0005456667 /DNA_START=301 /DNA_END=1341 /DNA_ORIENTATION=+
MCGEKQSVLKVYAIGKGKDVRSVVVDLSNAQRHKENAAPDGGLCPSSGSQVANTTAPGLHSDTVDFADCLWEQHPRSTGAAARKPLPDWTEFLPEEDYESLHEAASADRGNTHESTEHCYVTSLPEGAKRRRAQPRTHQHSEDAHGFASPPSSLKQNRGRHSFDGGAPGQDNRSGGNGGYQAGNWPKKHPAGRQTLHQEQQWPRINEAAATTSAPAFNQQPSSTRMPTRTDGPKRNLLGRIQHRRAGLSQPPQHQLACRTQTQSELLVSSMPQPLGTPTNIGKQNRWSMFLESGVQEPTTDAARQGEAIAPDGAPWLPSGWGGTWGQAIPHTSKMAEEAAFVTCQD